jgi:hypothetical protein
MEDRPSHQHARDLEEEFFAEENKRLLEVMRHKARQQQRREALVAVLGTDDDVLIDSLQRLDIEPETVLALTLVPLVVVAWADGRLEPEERDAVVRAAEEQGVRSGTPAGDMLASWLAHPPSHGLIDAWKRYAEVLWAGLGVDERKAWRDRTIGRARRVAEATGGFLGLTSKVSATERAALDDLESVLR